LVSNLLGTLWKSYGLRFKPIGDWPRESPTVLVSNLLGTLWKSYGLRFKPIGDWPRESPTVLVSNLLGTLWKSYGLRFKPIGDWPRESLTILGSNLLGTLWKSYCVFLSFGLTWGVLPLASPTESKSLVVSSAIELYFGYCQQLVSWVLKNKNKILEQLVELSIMSVDKGPASFGIIGHQMRNWEWKLYWRK